MNKVVFFDIDGTLTKGIKAHKQAFVKTFEAVFGVETEIGKYYGKTDQEIIFDVLQKHGISEAEIKSHMKEIIEKMIKFYEKFINTENIIVIEGVKGFLEELKKRKILISLITGNLKGIAKKKLGKVNLDCYFNFEIGAFGDDGMNRTELVKLAVRRVKKFHRSISRSQIYYFGDTPLDIKAGKESKIITVGVATGVYSVDELKEAGADFVFESLKNIKTILKELGI